MKRFTYLIIMAVLGVVGSLSILYQGEKSKQKQNPKTKSEFIYVDIKENVLLRGSFGGTIASFVCFNNEIVMVVASASRTMYAPDSWYGIGNICANSEKIKAKLIEKHGVEK